MFLVSYLDRPLALSVSFLGDAAVDFVMSGDYNLSAQIELLRQKFVFSLDLRSFLENSHALTGRMDRNGSKWTVRRQKDIVEFTNLAYEL